MAFWGVEVKPGEPYLHESSGQGRLRITQATLGNLESVGWSVIACSVGGTMPVRLCALNSTSGVYRLDLEYDEGQNVVFSVTGDSSVHLAGYYKKILGAATNVQALVIQSQEANDDETTNAHDIALARNALETEERNDGTNQLAGQAGLNIMISDEASFGSGHGPSYKEDIGGLIDELKIDELESGDCNGKVASDGKKVKVRYIGKLKNGEVVDSAEGGPAIYKFTLGVDQVIAGWHQGIKGMRVGAKRKLTIPPALGYKDKPQNETIPANSWLVYDIELLEVSEPVEGKRRKKSKKPRSVNRH